jgi:hypothetical protein
MRLALFEGAGGIEAAAEDREDASQPVGRHAADTPADGEALQRVEHADYPFRAHLALCPGAE